MSNIAKEINADLIAKFQYFDSYRKQWEEQAINCYKLYIGWKERRAEGLSNLHIPKTYEILDTIRSRLVKSFFGTRPYIDFIPLPSTYGNFDTVNLNEEKAKVASALVDMQLDKNNIVIKWHDYVTNMLIFPSAIMGIGWRYERSRVKNRVTEPEVIFHPIYGYQHTGRMFTKIIESVETIWDDNELINIDFFDFWPDPHGKDIDSCRGVFHREFCTRETLEKKLYYLQRQGEGSLYPIDLDALQGMTNIGEGRWARMNAVGYSADSHDVYHCEGKARNVYFELLHYWEDDRHAILVNRSECVYDGPNPYWRHGRKPFITQSYEQLPNEFYGRSAVDIIMDLQHEINTRHNQIMDNTNMIINKMWKVRKNADIDPSQLISRPNGVVEVEQMDDIELLIPGDMPNSAFISQQIEEQQIESTLGTPPLVRGSAGSEKTATEAMAKNTNASTRFDVKIILLENVSIKRLAMLMDLNNQQFVTDERLVNLSDGDSVQWQAVSPYEISGEFDYRPAGTAVDPAANKEVRREQLTNMMSFLINTQNPYIDLYALTKAWIESFDIRNSQKFLIPQEVLQQQMLQQMMMQGIPQGAGSGQPPGVNQIPMPKIALGNQMQEVMRLAG